MKKTYVAPRAELILLSLNESISASFDAPVIPEIPEIPEIPDDGAFDDGWMD